MRKLAIAAALAMAIGGTWYETTHGGTVMAQSTECANACCAVDVKVEEAPLACTITDPSAMKERLLETERLFKLALETIETETGYKMKFDRAHAADLFAYAQFESDCCGFIEFSITFERNNGPVWLHLAGSNDAKVIIASMLPSAR